MHNPLTKLGDYVMARPYKEAARQLSETAQGQQGFFTTKQAIHAGYAEKTHAYHVRKGNWLREHRGIYRLADFPTGERPDLMLWYLWSQNRKEVPEGTYSHETALSLHELSDIMPSKLPYSEDCSTESKSRHFRTMKSGNPCVSLQDGCADD